MPKRKGKGKSKESRRQETSTSGAADVTSPDPFLEEGPLEEFERVITFDDPTFNYDASSSTDPWASGSSGGAAQATSPVAKAKGVKSDKPLELKGPLEVQGSLRSMAYITFDGNFDVNGSVEAYGNVVLNGNLMVTEKIKTMGNIEINGDLLCKGKMKGFGKLDIVGNLEVEGPVEIWGAITITGYLKCKSLTAWSSLTTVGDDSGYEVEDKENIHGAKILNRAQIQG